MKKLKMKWIYNKQHYGQSKSLKMGKIIVGDVFYSSFVSKGDPNRYQANSRLPGIIGLGRFGTEEQAEKEVEKATIEWFKSIEED